MRRALAAFAAVVLIVVAALGIAAAVFDANALKPRIVEAARRSTGRELALNGRLSLSLFPLGLSARDVALSNVEGGSRPSMARLDRLDAGVALLPLLRHRIEVDRLVMVRPDILLERGADGRGNWEFAAEKPRAPVAPSPEKTTSATPWTVGVNGVEIDDGVLAWRGADVKTLDVKRLKLRESSDDAPISTELEASYARAPFTLAGTLGPLAGLRGGGASPWPVDLRFASGGATLTFEGALADPRRGRGWSGKLDAAAPDLVALAPFLPGVTLPAAHDVRLAARLADDGGPVPAVSALALHAGPSDLGALVPDLKVDVIDVAADRLDQPAKADVRGSYAGAPLVLKALLGPPAALLPDAKPSGPWPVDVTAQAAGATLSAKGALGTPRSFSGADVAVTANVPDLAALAPLLRTRLPALHDIAFAARVADAPDGFARGVALRGMTLTSPQFDVSGDLTLGRPRPSAAGSLTAGRLDLDAVLAAFKAAPEPPATQAAAPAAPAQPQPRAKPARVIPDAKLPLDSLRGADADLTLKIAAMRAGGADYRNLDGHLKLAAGKLTLDPFAADLPAGHATVTLGLDASQPVPPASLSVHAPQLAAKPAAQLLGLPGDLSGAVDVDLELRGAGDSPHAIAAGADGHLGLAMVGGTLDKAAVGPLLNEILRAAELGAGGGTTAVRCLAVRADVSHGLATLRALSLDTDQFALDGGGTVNLADETLALRVRPLVRLKGSGVSVPLDVGGTLAAPRAKVDISPAAVAGEAESVGKLPFGLVIGALGRQDAASDACAAALPAARGGAQGPAPAAAPPPPAQKSAKPADILRQLFK